VHIVSPLFSLCLVESVHCLTGTLHHANASIEWLTLSHASPLPTHTCRYTRQAGRVLPAGYTPGLFQVDVAMGTPDAAYPTFADAMLNGGYGGRTGGGRGVTPYGGYAAHVMPQRWSTSEVSTTLSVMVTAPCSATVGYTLRVASAPVAVDSGHVLTGDELVKDGTRGYIRPQSINELNANIESGVWTRDDVYVVVVVPSSTSTNSPFAFTTQAADNEEGGVVQTGTSTTVRVRYLPSTQPALG
jgi:hypothetical protein